METPTQTAPRHSAEHAASRAILRRIRILLVLFIIGLALSGVTAFALETEMKFLSSLLSTPGVGPSVYADVHAWILRVQTGLTTTNERYPFIAYGTDWLAFAHLVLAILFVGPLLNPVKNIWVIHFGLIACALVVPLALICGGIRGIPLGWQLIDCSFAVLGAVPLWLVRRETMKLESSNLAILGA